MKLKTTLAPIVAILSVAFVASDASAYYASHMGRWLTRDPILYQGSPLNLYQYVLSKPLSKLDALGLEAAPGGGQGRTSVFSICSHLDRDPEFDDYLKFLDDNKSPGRHDNAKDLAEQLRDQLRGGGCISELEIYGHGTPEKCGGVNASDGEDFNRPAPPESVRHFYKVRFCDSCVIYLDGCNTGLGGDLGIAQELATISGCKVYGSQGYLSGTHCNQDEKCKPEYDEPGYPIYPGSKTCEKDECWKGFSPK
jgi:hypothetical protein